MIVSRNLNLVFDDKSRKIFLKSLLEPAKHSSSNPFGIEDLNQLTKESRREKQYLLKTNLQRRKVWKFIRIVLETEAIEWVANFLLHSIN